MNKYQEALDVFNEVIARVNHYDGYTLVKDDLEPLVVGIKNLQELVDKVPYYETLEDKAKPKKVIKWLNDRSMACCPICHSAEYAEEMPKHCHYCGQAIDWSKDE